MLDALRMRGIVRRATIVFALLLAVLALGLAPRLTHAAGRAGPPGPNPYAPGLTAGAPAIAGRASAYALRASVDMSATALRASADMAWRTSARVYAAGSAWVAEAERWMGSANPTGTIGPWCADFISFVFRRVGKPPLASRMAASGFVYGAPLAGPEEGALIVTAYHIGLVAHVYADGSFDEVSGNWGRRVSLAHVARTAGMRFRRV